MAIIMLSERERDRFALWCEQEQKSNEGVIGQLTKLGPHGEIVAKQMRLEALAFSTVARKLRSIEQMTIRGGEQRTKP